MKNDKLVAEYIGKLLLKYSILAFIAMMVSTLNNVVDRIFIGNIPGFGPMATIMSINMIFVMPAFGFV